MLAQISVIAVAAVMLILAAVLWIVLAGNGSIETAPSSSQGQAMLSSQGSSTDGSSQTPSLSSIIESSSGSTVHPTEDTRTEYAPGPDSANDGVKRCYLTFDDGPSSKVTPQILDILDEYNVKATFFVKGTSNIELVDDIYNQGHAIGLHTDTHVYEDIYKSTDAYFADLTAVGNKVKEKIGFVPNIIRFPGGSSNTVSRNHCKGIMSTLVEEVEDRGYYYFDWNVDSYDASGNNKPVDYILEKTKSQFSTNQKNICILMHDINAKQTTADALPEMIEYIRDAGYEFCILNKYAYQFHHGVNN